MKLPLALASGLLLLSSPVFADYAKDYCGSKEFLGNAANKKPHLHCGKNFFTWSKTDKNHKNLTDLPTGKAKKAKCSTALGDIVTDVNNTSGLANKQEVVDAITAFGKAHCG